MPVADGAVWPARHAINIVAGASVAKVREITDRYRTEWAALGRAAEELPFLGINRFVVCADTDREALALGKRAWPLFYDNFMKLWRKYGTQPRYARVSDDFEIAVENGAAFGGSPATIRDLVYNQAKEAGVNYFISQFSFGDLSHEEETHSAGIFAREAIPVAREVAVSA